MPIRIEAGRVSSLASLEAERRALELRAPQAPIFQGWSWMGCLAAERFPCPVVVRAEVDGVELPIGVMLTGVLGRDDVLLSLAAQLEASHPWPARGVQPR